MPENLKHADYELALAIAHLEGKTSDGEPGDDIRRRVKAAKEHLRGHLFQSDLPDDLRPTLEGIVVVEVGALDGAELLGLAAKIEGLAGAVLAQVEQLEQGERAERVAQYSREQAVRQSREHTA